MKCEISVTFLIYFFIEQHHVFIDNPCNFNFTELTWLQIVKLNDIIVKILTFWHMQEVTFQIDFSCVHKNTATCIKKVVDEFLKFINVYSKCSWLLKWNNKIFNLKLLIMCILSNYIKLVKSLHNVLQIYSKVYQNTTYKL